MALIQLISHLFVGEIGTPNLPWAWSWDKLSTFTYGTNTSCCGSSDRSPHCCSGIDNTTEIRWKLRYNLDFIDNDLSVPGCRNDGGRGAVNWTMCNDFREAVRCILPMPQPCLSLLPGEPLANAMPHLNLSESSRNKGD